MTPLASAVLFMLLGLPPSTGDREAPEERATRLADVAQAIGEAAEQIPWPESRESLASVLVAQGYFESGFSKRIQEGHCRRYECDGGRARSPWQLHRGTQVPWDTWEQLGTQGVESVTLGARSAARILASTYRACGSLEGALGMYATGRTCEWGGSAKRAQMARSILGKLIVALR